MLYDREKIENLSRCLSEQTHSPMSNHIQSLRAVFQLIFHVYQALLILSLPPLIFSVFFLIYFAVTAIENRKEGSLKDRKITNTGKKKEYDLKPMSELLYCSYIDYFGTQKEDVTERLVVAGNLHFIKICILYYCS